MDVPVEQAKGQGNISLAPHVSPHAEEKMVCLNIHSMFLPKRQHVPKAVLQP